MTSTEIHQIQKDKYNNYKQRQNKFKMGVIFIYFYVFKDSQTNKWNRQH